MNIGMGRAELDQIVGKMHLYLAEHFPTSDYGLRAYDAFNLSLSKQESQQGYRTQALIRKGDSARVIGEMDEMVTCLENSLNLVNSKKKLSEISDVLNGIPDEWKKETPVIALQKELAHAITVTP